VRDGTFNTWFFFLVFILVFGYKQIEVAGASALLDQ
jgi:hypothetical protein